MSAYERNDPKHPGYLERVFDLADDSRTASRANPSPATTAGTSQPEGGQS